ncbi:MAG: GreA/GreB family elongation factor [Planctomycetota bacterium]
MADHAETAAKLKKLTKNKMYDELEEAILEALEEDSVAFDDLLTILDMAARRADPAVAESLAWMAVTSWAEKHGDEEALELARGAARGIPRSAVLREELSGLYLKVKADYPAVETVVERIFTGNTMPLPQAAKRADRALELPPGTYVVKRGRKDPGRVIGVAEGGEAIEVEFPAGNQLFRFEELDMVEVLPADHFRALSVFEPERLAERAAEAPGALVEDLLRAVGGELSYRELRGHLVDVIGTDWSKWWNGARGIVQRSPWIEMSVGRQPTLTLRRQALSHTDRVRDEFDEAETVDEQIVAVVEYLEQASEHAEDEVELVAYLAETLREVARDEEEDPAEALSAAAVLDRLRAVAPEASGDAAEPDISGVDPADLLLPIDDPRVKRAILERVQRTDPDGWTDFFAAAMPAGTAELCDWMARELAGAGRGGDLPGIAAGILKHPHELAEALIWVWKWAGNGELIGEKDGPDPERLLTDFLNVADRAARESRSAFAGKIRGAISSKNYASARVLMEAMNDRSARCVKEALNRFPGLTDMVRVHVTDLLVETHPNIYAEFVPPWEDEEVLYSTRAGLDAKNEEYSGFVHVKLPNIAEAIGKAASHGDLSENAEYTAALEERERLTERANALKAQLDIARILPDEFADGDIVTVGSRIVSRDAESGGEKTLTFLGPWDVDVEGGVFSYRAPLSQAFMGKKAGAVVEVEIDRETRRFEIVSIESALR